MIRSLPLALLLLAGCAPSADLTAPFPERTRTRGGSLVVVRLSDVEAEDALEDAAGFDGLYDHPPAFWDALRSALSGRFGTEAVRYEDLPEGTAVPTVRVLSERGQESWWHVVEMRVADAPPQSGEPAETVVVLDAVRLTLEGNQTVQSIAATADATVYREGAVLWAGRLTVVERGSGALPTVDRAAWERAVEELAERIGDASGLAAR